MPIVECHLIHTVWEQDSVMTLGVWFKDNWLNNRWKNTIKTEHRDWTWRYAEDWWERDSAFLAHTHTQKELIFRYTSSMCIKVMWCISTICSQSGMYTYASNVLSCSHLMHTHTHCVVYFASTISNRIAFV